MKLTYGLISSDSHGQVDKDAFTSRMSKNRWGDRIPHVTQLRQEGSNQTVDRWMVNGQMARSGGVCNCPAVMNDPERKYYPQRWDEVPPKVYNPIERLKALDEDGIDAEVLYHNDPGRGVFLNSKDAAFELACIQAFNDAFAEWSEVSDRFVPLATIPYLSPVATAVAEVERAVKKGHRGIVILGEPSMLMDGLKHFNDPYWDPLWAVCQDLEIPIHLHESGGLGMRISFPRWEGYTQNQFHSVLTVPTGAFPAQLIPNLIFSGILDRFPRLKWVSAETGVGWVSYVLEGCDHEWESHRLWTEGLLTRPSELFRRQVYVNFWFEKITSEILEIVGSGNVMWESDYPHTASTYPESWKYVEQTVEGLPESERRMVLHGNAMRLYNLGES